MLNCGLEDCENYIPYPKEFTPGECGRVKEGLPMLIGRKYFKFIVDQETHVKLEFPVCLFYRGSASSQRSERTRTLEETPNES